MAAPAKSNLLHVVGPGLLVAATGVGAGDLATASFAGSLLGTGVLWAVIVGALSKFVITEGLARWQLATGQTLLEGVVARLGRWLGWLFMPYLLLWSFFVGSALMAACGVTLHAMLPIFEDAANGKIVFGIVSSLAGLILVWRGGYRLFDRVMRVCIGLMFATVLLTAGLLWPGWGEVARGLLIPSIPDAQGLGFTWTLALLGGVGGTLTVLCYGYWIREEGRTGPEQLRACRIDLACGYLLTALFGLAMVIIGASVEIEGRGAGLLVTLSGKLAEPLGPAGKWLFLVGALGAVFSSLLGVWQAVPYIFADLWRLAFAGNGTGNARCNAPAGIDARAAPYRLYLLALAGLPMLGLVMSFQEIQKLYAIIGAAFIPLLALVLLALNGRAAWVGEGMRNRVPAVMTLAAIVLFFAWVALAKVFA